MLKRAYESRVQSYREGLKSQSLALFERKETLLCRAAGVKGREVDLDAWPGSAVSLINMHLHYLWGPANDYAAPRALIGSSGGRPFWRRGRGRGGKAPPPSPWEWGHKARRSAALNLLMQSPHGKGGGGWLLAVVS